MTTLHVSLSFFALALAFSYPAHADDKVTARAYYETAARLYDVGEYERALTGFKAAYVAAEDPAFLYNIGQCYRKLGQEEQALDLYRRFLRYAPADDPNRAQVEARYRDTEVDATFKADFARAAEKRETVEAAPAPVAAQAVPPPVLPVPAPVVVELPKPPATPARDTGRGLRIAGVATAGAGLASIGTAIYFYTRAVHYSDVVSTNPHHTSADLQAGENAVTAQWILYSVGGVALAGGAVLYWLGWRVTPVAGPGLAGISTGGTF